MKSIRAIQGGRHARINGQNFERLIDMACQRYKEDGKAWIEKTPEPMKPLGKQNGRGQFLACYTKQAQPDYKGTLRGGRTVVFEAKHTDAERIERSRLTEEQMEALRAHEALGAYCFILVSFRFDKFYRVPFYAWDDMKTQYGKVSMNEKDLAPFLLRGGIMDFLGPTEDKEKRGAPEAFSTLKRQTAGQRIGGEMDLKIAIEFCDFISHDPILPPGQKKALKIMVEAAEKQVPSWLRRRKSDWRIECRTCGHIFEEGDRPKFCPACGQALDWQE